VSSGIGAPLLGPLPPPPGDRSVSTASLPSNILRFIDMADQEPHRSSFRRGNRKLTGQRAPRIRLEFCTFASRTGLFDSILRLYGDTMIQRLPPPRFVLRPPGTGPFPSREEAPRRFARHPVGRVSPDFGFDPGLPPSRLRCGACRARRVFHPVLPPSSGFAADPARAPSSTVSCGITSPRSASRHENARLVSR